MSFKDIIGHERIIQRLRTAHREGRLGQAYLLHGMDGIGKRLIAKTLAKVANCDSPIDAYDNSRPVGTPPAGDSRGLSDACGDCHSCRNIQAETHPDYVCIRPDQSQIRIGPIRDLQGTVGLRPISGRLRFVLIDQADRMNEEAANALLKILEEPPPDTVIVLITSRPYAIIPTVLSRCQRIRFPSLTTTQVLRGLKQQGGGPQQSRRLAELCMGSLGLALSLEPGQLESDLRAIDDFLTSLNGLSPESIVRFAQQHAQDRETTERALQWIGLWLRDLLLIKLGHMGSLMVAQTPSPAVSAIAGFLRVEQIVALAGRIHWIRTSLIRNINRQLALEALLLQLRDEIRSES